MKKDYQVLARKYRPQTFAEVVGQEAIVTTLKNAIKRNQLAHAYLFCGPRGTGKTTLARLLAKALNCLHPTSEQEPCNQCASCREITAGHSLDVLEIDGASHRGIDDIRQINDTVGYATASGKYKIYIIDEVHMLTKEAFNALLKTLEEPPANVKFFFATTEGHKVLPTILSRCQRFNLNRIGVEAIMEKLGQIAQELNVQIEEDALRLLATRAEGGLRDAESLLDQILAFHSGDITGEVVASVLGMMSRECFFALDKAGKEARLSTAFEVAHQVISQGKDVAHFIESLTEHFRHILLIKLAGKQAPFLSLSSQERDRYEESAKLYSQEQCLTLIDLLVDAQQQRMISSRVTLEALLLRILRSHQRVPVDFLVRRLSELEERLGSGNATLQKVSEPIVAPPPEVITRSVITHSRDAMPQKGSEPVMAPPPEVVTRPKKKSTAPPPSLTEDPTPSRADLGLKETKETPAPARIPVELGARLTPEAAADAAKQQLRYETLLQFASIELEGRIERNRK